MESQAHRVFEPIIAASVAGLRLTCPCIKCCTKVSELIEFLVGQELHSPNQYVAVRDACSAWVLEQCPRLASVLPFPAGASDAVGWSWRRGLRRRFPEGVSLPPMPPGRCAVPGRDRRAEAALAVRIAAAVGLQAQEAGAERHVIIAPDQETADRMVADLLKDRFAFGKVPSAGFLIQTVIDPNRRGA